MSKNAVVFGGSGFLGSHVCDVLSSEGFNVTIFDKAQSPYITKEQTFIQGDILDTNAVNEVLKNKDYVLNFAGYADLDDCKNAPFEASKVNILGNLNILEGMKETKPSRYVFASSYYVYSESGSIYRITKQSCELYIEEYARVHKVDYTILRFGSLYGTRANNKNSVHKYIKEALEKSSITRNGSGEDIREFINVKDAARATYETMLKKNFINKHVILAGNQKITIKELLDLINEMMENKLELIFKEKDKNDTDHYKITPYTFAPKVAFRYHSEIYHDLGQGLLEVFQSIYESNERNKNLKQPVLSNLDV